MTGWTFAWVLWIVMFFAIEGPAIANKEKGDTLSEHVWKWFAITWSENMPGQWRVRRFILIAFLAWVSGHFLSGGKF